MDITQIIGFALIATFIILVLKQYKPEFATLISICGGLLIFLMSIEGIEEIVSLFINIENELGDVIIVKPVMKILGIGYITEFTADLAEDGGNKSIATKVIFGGKVAICLVSIPIIKELINAITSLI